MAITLNVDLSDSEQNLLFLLAEQENPGADNATKRVWAEAVAKNGLREKLWQLRAEQVRDDQAAERQTEAATFTADWPITPT